MVRLYIRHPVTDYQAWRKVYDGFDAERRSMGVVGHAVYRAVNDPNDVTAWHDFDTREAAEAFVHSDRLREAMADAGVAGVPETWIVAEAT
jgi:heme-degrading monooxygenase HmoA